MMEQNSKYYSNEKRFLIGEPKLDNIEINLANSVQEVAKLNSRPNYFNELKQDKVTRKKQPNLQQSSFTKVKNIYEQSLTTELLKSIFSQLAYLQGKKRALMNQNSLSIGTPTGLSRFESQKRNTTIDTQQSPKRKVVDTLFELRISPIRSSLKTDTLQVKKPASPKQNSSLHDSIQEMHSLELQNRSLNARKKRFVPKNKLSLDTSLRTRPYPPEYSHFASLNQEDSFSRDDVKYYSHNNSINNNTYNNSSFMSSIIGSTDTSILADLSGQDINDSGLKAKRRLTVPRNQVWMNILKNGIVKPNSSLIPEDIKAHYKTEDQKGKKTLATIEHDERENDSPTTHMTSKGYHLEKTLVESEEPLNTTAERIVPKDLNESKSSIHSKNSTGNSKKPRLIKKKDKSLSKENSVSKTLEFPEMRSQSMPNYQSVEADKIKVPRENSPFTPEQRSMIEIAINNIKAPIPDNKFPYKLVTEKHYEFHVTKFQKIKTLFDQFRKQWDANKEKANFAPFKQPRAKATQKLSKSTSQSKATETSTPEGPKENINTVNTATSNNEEGDPTIELEKTKQVLKKKNDAIKYLKYHYVKLKKKNITTAFNMLGRLLKRRVYRPTFSTIYEGNESQLNV